MFIGAAKGGLGDILTAGLTHPGFTASLAVWSRVVTDRTELAALPVFALGVVAAPVVFLGLRWAGLGRAACLVAGSLMAVAPAHVVFSGRVKPYVLETLLVLLVGLLVHRLHRCVWTWKRAAGWVVGAFLLALMSSFLIVATAIAVLLMAFHARGDLLPRVGAVAVQGVLQLALLLTTRRQFDSGELADWWAEPPVDGKVDLHANPVDMIAEIGSKLRHLGAAAVEGNGAITLTTMVISILGLIVWARRGPLAAMAQFFGLLVLVAFIGGVLQQIPFGATVETFGTRTALWLVPSILVGVAFAVESVATRIGSGSSAARGTVMGLAVAVAVVVVALGGDVDPPANFDYTNIGTRSANEFVQEVAGPGDAMIVFPLGWFSHAAEPGVDLLIRKDPELITGFFPEPADPGVWVLWEGDVWDGSLAEVERRVGRSRRVVIHDAPAGFGDPQLPELLLALEALGYEEVQRESFSFVLVIALEHSDR